MRTGLPDDVTRLPETDVVVVGLGWAGGIVAAELARSGMAVVALERGPLREPPDSAFSRKHDELRFKVRHELMQDLAGETWTFRHHAREAALPIRRLGAFLPGTGVGGAAGHYGGNTTRFAEWEFEARSRTAARYGPSAIPEDCTLQDWDMTYGDLEPYYDRFEQMAGVSGQAGNISGRQVDGGNPYEGSRSRGFPLPAHPGGAAAEVFVDACQALGWHPFPTARAILSRPYTNPDGIERQACVYCGDCTYHVCAVDARADARVTVLPVARRSPRFELRTDANVFRVLHDGQRAHGVLYRGPGGSICEQPAERVVLAAYTFNNVRLLLLSGIGRPYDPETNEGMIGKNYAYNCHAHGAAFLEDRRFHGYAGTGGATHAVADWAADNFDHSGLGFIGGAQIQGGGGGGAPIHGIAVPPGTPAWGERWKRAARAWYDHSTTVSAIGNVLPHRGNHLDLDPVYRDAFGDPLLRITFDWHANEWALAEFAAGKVRAILDAMRPAAAAVSWDVGAFDSARYQGTHNTGGAMLGADPSCSAVDLDLRSWDLDNLWVVGGSAFPHNGTPGPTATICALAYKAADSIRAAGGRRVPDAVLQ